MTLRTRMAVALLVGAGLRVGGARAQDVPPPGRFPAPPAGSQVPQAGSARSEPARSEPAQGASGETTLRIGTRIVVLDVVVTDKKGNLVPGLTRDDFTVFENGKLQALGSFDGPSAHEMPAGVEVRSSADLKRIGDAPVTVLVLDALNTKFEDIAFSRQALVKFLNAQPAVLAQPMVLMMATDTRFRLLHDYTQNRAELIDAVKHAPAEIPNKKNQGRNGEAAVERMAQSLASLEQIAQASAGTAGRKNVIWVGEGFPSADVVGLDPKTSATIEAAVKQATNMLLAARVTMYTINPVANDTTTYDQQSAEDLAGAGGDGPEPFAGAVQFETFAPSTGGRAFRSRNDLGNEVAEGIAAGATYYTMSYRPSDDGDDLAKYRHVRIVMKDPNLRAMTRDGYYPPTRATENIASVEPPKQAAAQLRLDLSSAVNSAIPYNGLAVKATKVGANYVVQVESAGLDWHAVAGGKESTEATVVAAWYDAKDKLLGHVGKELTSVRTPPADALKPGSAAFVLPLAVPATGVARVRFLVRDAANGKMGTVDLKP